MQVKPGDYAIKAVFRNRRGELIHQECGCLHVYDGSNSYDEVLGQARSWISMTGLHNYGLATERRRGADGCICYEQTIAFTVVQYAEPFGKPLTGEPMKLGSRCVVNGAGHIVRS